MLQKQNCLERKVSGLVEVSDLLEPCEWQLSSTVLRGEGRSDTTFLPDRAGKGELASLGKVRTGD